MKSRTLCYLLGAVLTFMFLTYALPAMADPGTGEVTCVYRFHQSYTQPVNDLHLLVQTVPGTTIQFVSSVRTSPYTPMVKVTRLTADMEDIYIKWPTNIPYCTWVRVAIRMRLVGTVCSNQQYLCGSWWTYNGNTVGPTRVQNHGWSINPRIIQGGQDIYPFFLENTSNSVIYMRGLQFHWGNTPIDGLPLSEWQTWPINAGDFAIQPLDTLPYDIVIPHTASPQHIHGHFQLWSQQTGGELLGEAWFHHYDYGYLAAQMGEMAAADNGDGSITVRWNTASEVDIAGFNVYRGVGAEGEMIAINTDLIPAQGMASQGADYSFTDWDVPGDGTYSYWVEDVDLGGTSMIHGPILVVTRQEPSVAPAITFLHGYPNPFRSDATIEYALSTASPVKVEVYDLIGRRVATLKDGYQEQGRSTVTWNGRDLNGAEVPSGVYLCRVTAGQFSEVSRMMLLR